MKTKNGFVLLDSSEFSDWLNDQTLYRSVNLIQNHHTYIPSYTHFDGTNHFEKLTAMKEYHVNNNGWSDIAQNITTFPDGKVAICRPLDKIPAGIKGVNSRGICIEHLGNFDLSGDNMTEEHKHCIIHVNAVLCHRYNLTPDIDTIVYHHWYDLVTGKRRDGNGTTKSCPGTNFFGGNKVTDATDKFIPLVRKELLANKSGGDRNVKTVIKEIQSDFVQGAELQLGIVTAQVLNIRGGAGAKYPKVGKVEFGTVVTIHKEKDGWYKLEGDNHWVSAKYVRRLEQARVTAAELNVRSGPGVKFTVIDKLKQDDSVFIYERSTNWRKISPSEKWVSAKYLD